MAGLVVGGVTIPISWSGVKRVRSDLVDRARAFDGTYRASASGNAKRDWRFATPPIPRATADTYESTLATVTAQTCSGDVLGGSVSCFSEITGWDPVVTAQGHSVVIEFTLHEA